MARLFAVIRVSLRLNLGMMNFGEVLVVAFLCCCILNCEAALAIMTMPVLEIVTDCLRIATNYL